MNHQDTKTRRRTNTWLIPFSTLCLCAFVVHSSFAADPALPKIPEKTVNLTEFGAVADGTTVNTQAITKAIASLKSAGGGHLLIPSGKFLTGPFSLTSNLDLHLDKGAQLLQINDIATYPIVNGRYQDWITADACHDISITGQGTIDGQGQPWWDKYRKHDGVNPSESLTHRANMILLNRCERVLVKDVLLTNSGMFHLVPRDCRDVTIEGIHIKAPANAPNTDGIDPSGWNFKFDHCTFDVGDDCIAIKPQRKPKEEGRLSCEDFTITHCTFNHGHGMSIGGQTPGGLRRLTIKDCTFDSTEAGIRMKANRGSGGLVEDVTCENLTMKNVKVAIFITSYYPTIPADVLADPAQPVTAKTPIWKNIRISNVKAEGGAEAGRIFGLAEMPVENVTLTNVQISAGKGLQIIHAKGIDLVNTTIKAASGEAIITKDAQITGAPSNSQ
jgi:polygalacturonase